MNLFSRFAQKIVVSVQRHILRAIILGCSMLLLLPTLANASEKQLPQLRIAGWDVYADPFRRDKTIGYAEFETNNQVSIVYTPLSTLDEIINAAESENEFDLFIISNEGIRTLYEMDLLAPIDVTTISNYDDLHHNLRYTRWAQFDRNIYAVPWAWGPTGLLYDADQIDPPQSWQVLWEPKLQGKVALWDDVSMIWIAALSMGYKNVYNLTRPQLQAVKQKLLQLNRQVYGYYSGDQQAMDYILQGEVAVLNSWFDPSRRLKQQGRNFSMIIPKEGAVGMFDSYVIAKQSKQKDLAQKLIDQQISPSTQRDMVHSTGLAPANIETLTLLSEQEIVALHLNELDYFDRMLLWDVMPRKHLYKQVLDAVQQDLQQLQAGK